MDIVLVTDDADVPSALAQVAGSVVGVDVERSDGERYHRAAALVQVGVEGRCVALDPLAISDLTALRAFLDGRLAVLHAIENDLEPLEAGGAPLVRDDAPAHEQVADTGVAAAMLGLPTGLSPLLTEILGVELTGDKERFQRADWAARPLAEDMLAYAAGDVVHLPDLWRELEARLEDAGRRAWYEQELAATIAHAEADTRSWSRTKGAGRLDGHGRAILRALWEERETIAVAEDLAPQRVVRDDALIKLADDPPGSVKAMTSRGVRRNQVRRHGQRLLQALQRGATAPDEPSPSGMRRSTDEDRKAYDRLRKQRAAVADELGIDAGVLCPSRVLWPAVLGDPQTADELCDQAGLRPWQRELLAERLWEAYRDEDG